MEIYFSQFWRLETFLLYSHMVVRERESTLLSSSYSGTNPIMGASPSQPHLTWLPLKGPTTKYHCIEGLQLHHMNLGGAHLTYNIILLRLLSSVNSTQMSFLPGPCPDGPMNWLILLWDSTFFAFYHSIRFIYVTASTHRFSQLHLAGV